LAGWNEKEVITLAMAGDPKRLKNSKSDLKKICQMATKGRKKMKRMTKVVLLNISPKSPQAEQLAKAVNAILPECKITKHKGKFAILASGNWMKALGFHSRLMEYFNYNFSQAGTVSLIEIPKRKRALFNLKRRKSLDLRICPLAH
jgi:DNA-directed RNA polymerase specialized sigma54-like protein